MAKLPPKEKVVESYSAIEDERVSLYENYAIVKSSNKTKEYLIKWNNNLYYSNDNSSYWQGVMGYPIIAVLMLQNKLSLNRDILKYFKNINWNKLNQDTKRDYQASLEKVLENLSLEEKEIIYNEINKVYEEIKSLNIKLTIKRNL